MLRLFLVLILFCSSIYCNAQIILSQGFSNDIKSSCTVCKLDTMYFSRYINNDFHLAHYYFIRDKIDSSFMSISRLLNQTGELSNKELYVIYHLKGIILRKKKLYEASCESLNRALLQLKSIKEVESVNNVYIKLSENYINQDNFEEAISILENWKKEDGIDHESSLASKNFHNLGISYMHLENYKDANENLMQSHQLNLKYANSSDLAYSSMDLANLYYEQYMDSIAIVYFKQGLDYAKESDDLEILEAAYQNMGVVEENRENFKKALFYKKESQKVRDSIWNRDKIWELAQSDKAIAAAISKEKLRTEQSKAKRLLTFVSLLLILLSLVSFFVYKINKQRKLISDQKDDLEDLHRLKDDLFAILGHDLRAPMHHLLTINRQMIKASEQVKGTPIFDLIGKNSLASGKMHLILDKLLNWILVKSDKGYFEHELINVDRLVQMVKFNFEALLDHKSISFSSNITGHLTVFADANSLKVILRNVLDNAIKFTPKHGHISIEGKTDKDEVTLIIKDNGSGMDTKKIHRVAKSSTDLDSNKRQSTGLGLKLCQSFLKRNNGHFRIESEIGKGTSVIISLPSKG